MLCMVGSSPLLGAWDTHHASIMNYDASSWQSASVDLSKIEGDVHYKYGVWDIENKQFSYFEHGADRIVPSAAKKEQVIVNDTFVRVDNQSISRCRCKYSVFSLRSNKSFGVGDFADLKLMVDWAKRVAHETDSSVTAQ